MHMLWYAGVPVLCFMHEHVTENGATSRSVGVGGSSYAQSHRLHIARVPIASMAATTHAVVNIYTS